MQKFNAVMKTFVFLIFISCSVYFTAAAQRQNTYFIKTGGDYVTNIDSADYIRVVQEQEKGSFLYPTKEFYKSGDKKSMGYSSRIDPPRYEGQFISYFENGKKKQVINYKLGKITDTVYSYYPNGKLYSALSYTQTKDTTLVYINTVKDSAGVDLVANGNGKAVLYDEDLNYITGQGNIKNGTYDGNWSGEVRGKDTLTYKEIYAEGKLLSGESMDGKGKVYQYTIPEIKPGFKGGMTAFYKYISREVKYPAHLVRQRVQGVAQIKFVIRSNGEISNVHLLNDVHADLGAEAIRVIKAAKGWQPGVQKGRAVNVYYVIPVSFALSN